MPKFRITNPETGDATIIQAARAPTQEEALEFFGSSGVQSASSPSTVARGGFEYPVTPTVAKALAGQRVYERALEAGQVAPQVSPEGEILQPGLSSDIRSFIEGTGSGVSIGATDALSRILGAKSFNDPNQPRQQSPEAFQWGNLAGSIVNPLTLGGRAASSVAPTLRELILGGTRTGAGIGATAGATGVLTERGQETTLPELAVGTGLGTLVGAGLGGAIPAAIGAPAALKEPAQRLQKALTEKITKANRSLDDAVVARSEFDAQAARDLEQLILERGKQVTKVGQEAEEQALQQTLNQEKLLAAQQAAEVAQGTALATSRQLAPEIQALEVLTSESPKLVGRISAKTPPRLEPAAFGEEISPAIKAEYAAAKELTDKDFGAIKDVLPEVQAKMTPSNLIAVGTDLKKGEAAGLSSIGSSKLKEVLLEIVPAKKTGKLPPDVQAVYDLNKNNPAMQQQILAAYPEATKDVGIKFNWDDLQANLRKFNNKLHEAVQNEDGAGIHVYGKLRKATLDDMDEYANATGTEAKSLLDTANLNFVAREEKFGTSRIQPLISERMLENPNLLVDKIVTDNNAPVVNNLRQILNPEQFAQVQAQYVGKLFSPTKGVSFEPSHFAKQFEAVNDETLVAAFGKEGFTAMKSLYNASKGAERLSELQKISTDLNATAQKAADDFASATTTAQQNAIKSSFKSQAAKELDEIDALIAEVKERTTSADNLKKIKALERNVEDAKLAVEKAQDPFRSPTFNRIGSGVTGVGVGFMSGNPLLGILAGAGTLAGAGVVGRAIITPVGMSLLNKAANAKAGDPSVRALSNYISEFSASPAIQNPVPDETLESSISKSIRESER